MGGSWHATAVMEVAGAHDRAGPFLYLGMAGRISGSRPTRGRFVLWNWDCQSSAPRRSRTALGIRLDNWPAALRNALPIVAVGVCVPLALGAALDSWHFPSWKHSVASLPWMIAWATAQQYGLVCFLYPRLLEIVQSPRGATFGAAALFAAFHLPNPLLVAVTLSRERRVMQSARPNGFMLGIAHASASPPALRSIH